VLAELITPGSRWTLVGGKGGVGKTTVAAALALEFADRGEQTLVLSVDPAHSLGDALEVALGPEPTAIPGVHRLCALEVDAERERAAFLAHHREVLVALFERGTYLAPEEVQEFLDLSLPGMDELGALLRLVELAQREAYERVVIDTAPTGHTLRLLSAPRLAQGWMAALEALEARHRAVAQAFSPAYAGDAARRFLDSLDRDLRDVADRLTDPAHTRFLLVTTPEPTVAAETRRYREALADRSVALGGIIVNRCGPSPPDPLLRERGSGGEGTAHLPLLPEEPRGPDGLRRFAAAAQSAAPTAPQPPAAPTSAAAGAALRVIGPYRPPADRRLYLVGGKGGVGKTTVASALALTLADSSGGPVLLLSSDPAGSLAEVWQVPVTGEPRPAPGAPGLELRQLEAAAAWEAFRTAYRAELEGLFRDALGPGLSAEPDRRVAEQLLGLAPPGVDELMALLEVVDLLQTPDYNALILDTAPTGHLLRLLEMPGLALDWAHAVMRLLLRYREAIGLGVLAQRTLRFAREVRALREALQDADRTWLMVVALPEALSVPETRRLLPRLRALGMRVDVLLVNRLFAPDGSTPGARLPAAGALLASEAVPVRAGAPARAEGPQGAAELRRFAGAWQRLEVD
jgi:arsenite/tail-anchored protein-transporting ATPase